MAYANFKPLIWSKYIQHELSKYTIFENDCDYQFKGEVGRGKTVKILGVARPTIGSYTGASIGTPETVPDSSILMPIDQAKYFNFMVDDVDEAQSQEGLMQALMKESTLAMAEERDTYIAELIGKDTNIYMASSAEIDADTEAKAAIDAGLKYLWDNGARHLPITIYLNPSMYLLMQDYLVGKKTDNDAEIASGVIGKYLGASIKMSNNFYNDGTDDYCFIKTSKAVAFCSGINEVEAYRPEGYFSDAVKGLNTFGGKIVRDKEIYVIKQHD